MVHLKLLFGVPLKHSSFQTSADVKPILNNLVHAMPWQVHVCSLCVNYDFYGSTINLYEKFMRVCVDAKTSSQTTVSIMDLLRQSA